ncbi:MAG: hypothetical protein IJ658_10020 [Kiritimatiellae bacterium]|nr:hypothetical protein [Kiritimatiellia bacterium]
MRIQRREFPKASVASACLFNIGCAGFGQGRRAQLAKGAKMRVALIGCGGQARVIINAVLAEKLVAMVDPDPAMFKKMARHVATYAKNGILFVGSKVNLWFTHHGGYRFLPSSAGWCHPRLDRQPDFNYTRNTKPHVLDFYNAIREGRQADDPFTYSVPLAKTVCLGNLAALAGKGATLMWDGHAVTNDEKIGRLVTKECRNGWNPFAV